MIDKDYFKKDKIHVFSVKMLKSVCKEFKLPHKSRDNKSSLTEKVMPLLHYTGLHRSVAIFITDWAVVYITPL